MIKKLFMLLLLGFGMISGNLYAEQELYEKEYGKHYEGKVFFYNPYKISHINSDFTGTKGMYFIDEEGFKRDVRIVILPYFNESKSRVDYNSNKHAVFLLIPAIEKRFVWAYDWGDGFKGYQEYNEEELVGKDYAHDADFIRNFLKTAFSSCQERNAEIINMIKADPRLLSNLTVLNLSLEEYENIRPEYRDDNIALYIAEYVPEFEKLGDYNNVYDNYYPYKSIFGSVGSASEVFNRNRINITNDCNN